MVRRVVNNLTESRADGVAGVITLHDLMPGTQSGKVGGSTFAIPFPISRLNDFANKMIKRKQHVVGYPVNQDLCMKDFYHWYLNSGLCNVSMNNVGNPRKEGVLMNSHEFENEVIEYFASFFGFKPDESWGLVTHSGTDGNMHGMYFGVKYLFDKTKQLPIVYVSEQAHYSIRKLADLQNLQTIIIPALPMGQMDVSAFEKAIDPTQPALVVVAIGTTFKGAIDDHPGIVAALRRANPPAVYTMLDAALFGGYIPFSPFKDVINRQKLAFDAIAVSGHKFFGFDEPLGLFITTKEVLDSQKPFQVKYLNDAVPTITCSRSALGALKFWWQIARNGEREYVRQAAYILETAKYLKDNLDKMNYPAWLNPMSNTVFFKRPGDWIMHKWDLAPDYDIRLCGSLAHEILMQHESRNTVDEFITDLSKDVSASSG